MNTENNKEVEAQILIRTTGSNHNSGATNIADKTRTNMTKILEKALELNIYI